MAKSREVLAKFLTRVFESKTVTKSKLSDDTGIGRSVIAGYLNKANAASIDQLDRLAENLDKEPWELIKPPGAEPTESCESILGKIVVLAARFNRDQLKDLLLSAKAIDRRSGAAAPQLADEIKKKPE